MDADLSFQRRAGPWQLPMKHCSFPPLPQQPQVQLSPHQSQQGRLNSNNSKTPLQTSMATRLVLHRSQGQASTRRALLAAGALRQISWR